MKPIILAGAAALLLATGGTSFAQATQSPANAAPGSTHTPPTGGYSTNANGSAVGSHPLSAGSTPSTSPSGTADAEGHATNRKVGSPTGRNDPAPQSQQRQ